MDRTRNGKHGETSEKRVRAVMDKLRRLGLDEIEAFALLVMEDRTLCGIFVDAQEALIAEETVGS